MDTDRRRPGWRLRPATWEDFDHVLALIAAADTTTSGTPGVTDRELRAEWAERDLSDQAWVAVTPDGRVVGYADAAARGPGQVDADGYLHPDVLGRGVGTALVQATEAWASRQPATQSDPVGLLVCNGINGRNRAARTLLEGQGYAAVRTFWRMEIGLTTPPPPPLWPPGIAVRPCATDADERAAFAVVDEAMADHWGHVRDDFERKARYGVDPRLWHLATAGDEPVGSAITGLEGDTGWVRDLAVHRRWRGRGLCRALLLRALGEFNRRGTPRVALNIDTANPTGATRLYVGVGMVAVDEDVLYRKELRRGG